MKYSAETLARQSQSEAPAKAPRRYQGLQGATDGSAAVCPLTVIVPAYNEAETIADTLRSLQQQTLKPEQIIVVDDCSTDGTGDIARQFGVRVLTPPENTGSKAGAQCFALHEVHTEYSMAIDADTTLAPNAIELLMPSMDDEKVAASCGFVLPRYVRSLWERGRYVEYMLAFSFYKPLQDYYGKPLISSGCFSLYRTAILKEIGAWSNRTMAEDMDLTWTLYQSGYAVRFLPEAVCYPVEPHNFHFMSKQLRRWSHGFVQNLRLHWRGLLSVPYLRSVIAVTTWDATVASFVYLLLIPLLAFFISPLFLLGYVVDLPVVAVPVLSKALSRGEFWQAFVSLPAFFVLRTINGIFFLEALIKELVIKRSMTVYEKGH